MKKYTYKVYSENGTYLTNWKDVISEFSYSKEINSPGHELVVTLKRAPEDYGEGTDIDFNYRVKVYCHDDDANELLMFYGYITAYTPTYGQDDQVDVTCFSVGSRVNDSIHEILFNDLYNQTGAEFVIANFGNSTVGSTSFDAEADGFISTFDFYVHQDVGSYDELEYDLTLEIWSTGFGTLYSTSTLPAGTKAVYANSRENALIGYTRPYAAFRFTIDLPFQLIMGENYGIKVKALGSPTANDYSILSTSSYPTLVSKAYSTSGLTTIAYNSADPSSILRAIINEYAVAGGELTYDTSIADTGTTVSYTFNTNTVLEAIQKVVELCPVGWYWYIGADGLVYLQNKSNTPDHYFSLYKDIQNLEIKKKTEDMVNKIYFTGSEDISFYMVFKNDESINKYGTKSTRYVDGRVSDVETAETICNSILETRSSPELQASITIMDSNGGDGLGYDIESIEVGDVVAIRNVSQTVGLSSWDVARWDEDYWDYNIQNLASINMQVQKITYHPDYVTIEASTIAPDVNKRIEDINRNLEALQTVNNPDTPT